MNSIYNSIDILKQNGFNGGLSIAALKRSCSILPDAPGVYLITKPLEQKADFLTVGTGGHFKGKNPNVPISELEANWIDESIVVYIGKATSLRSRLNQYMKFGSGKNVGHWGGRYIWQLSYADELLVWWLPNDNPRDTEKEMINDFKQEYGLRPFANLQD